MKIEEWPSRAKRGEMVPNGVKQGQTGPNGAKKGLTGPNKAKWGHMELIFCMHAYFHEQPRPSDKNWPSYGDFVDSKILIGLH